MTAGVPKGLTPRAVGGFIAGGAIGGLPLAAAGAVAAILVLAFRRRREPEGRLRAIEAQMPDALDTMAAALRAGHNIAQALDAARDAASPPLREVLEEALARLEVGGSTDDAIEVLVARSPPEAGRLVGLALRVGRVAGTSLPAMLDSVSSTLVERARLAADRRATTAQGRFSASVVAAMPLAFFLLLGTGGGDAAGILLGSAAGYAALGAGLALQAAGILWTRRLLRGP